MTMDYRNPLDIIPMSPEEIADLVHRARTWRPMEITDDDLERYQERRRGPGRVTHTEPRAAGHPRRTSLNISIVAYERLRYAADAAGCTMMHLLEMALAGIAGRG